MLKKIRRSLQAMWSSVHEFCVFWEPHEYSHYTVECPEGHQTELPRGQVLGFAHVASQLAYVEMFCPDNKVLQISYTDCPHPECQKRVRQHELTFDEDDGDWFCEDVYAVTTYDFNDLGLGAVG